jgi:outer membrane protein assembly factor BamB
MTTRRLALAVAATALAALGATAIPAAAAAGSTRSNGNGDQSPSCNAPDHYEHATHKGYSCTTLPAVPAQLWQVTLNGEASYPVIAGGRVFVTTSASGGSYGGWLYALDASSGKVLWGPVPLSGTYYDFPLAFGDGRVFVNDFDGTVRAFNAKTGAQKWATPTNYFSGEPTVADGEVWVQGSSDVYGLDEKSGDIVTRSPGLDGEASTVAVTSKSIYVSAGCKSQYRLDLTGAILWQDHQDCDGGGSGVAYTADHQFYGSDGDLVMTSKTGAVVSTFAGVPAFDANNAYFGFGSGVYAQTRDGGVPAWTTDVTDDITAGPIVTDNAVYVATTEPQIVALDPATGTTLGTISLPAEVSTANNSPDGGFAIGDNLLVAPTGNVVTAFGESN